MHNPQLETKLQHTISQAVDNKEIFGVTANVAKGDGSFSFRGSAGNLNPTRQYFIASTTKLYITAIIMRLREQGNLRLDDSITKFLDAPILQNLLIFNGIDYTSEITIKHLLAHTSGLPDYFQQKRANGTSLETELTSGNDQAWTFEQALDAAKKLKPPFKPGAPGKALYSDTNYQILGRIVELITAKKIATVLREFIFEPLHLAQTYLYENSQDTTPAALYFKTKPLAIPLAMTSFGADGGIVSTADETMQFVQAFFNGELFPRAYFDEMKHWNKIFFPLEYGVGLARFKLPRIFSPFKDQPELLGHSGLSGAFAFYAPAKDVYLAGTINQIHRPDRSFRLMLRLLNEF